MIDTRTPTFHTLKCMRTQRHDDLSCGSGQRFIKVAMIAISAAGMATFFIINQSGGNITPVVIIVAIPGQVCYHSIFYETVPW